MKALATVFLFVFSTISANNKSSIDSFFEEDTRAVVLVFIATDCPIANRFSPYINRLAGFYGPQHHVRFIAVYTEKNLEEKRAHAHLQNYLPNLTMFIDVDAALAKQTEATVTPESVVYQRVSKDKVKLIYRGRIHDQYEDFGKWRHQPTKEDLKEVLQKLARSEAVSFRETQAVGCYIDLR